MARKKTEADLEARIHAVLKLAFPWLPPDDTAAELGNARRCHRDVYFVRT
jgi:hypothetical protein